jgi:hypothetical protein
VSLGARCDEIIAEIDQVLAVAEASGIEAASPHYEPLAESIRQAMRGTWHGVLTHDEHKALSAA